MCAEIFKHGLPLLVGVHKKNTRMGNSKNLEWGTLRTWNGPNITIGASGIPRNCSFTQASQPVIQVCCLTPASPAMSDSQVSIASPAKKTLVPRKQSAAASAAALAASAPVVITKKTGGRTKKAAVTPAATATTDEPVAAVAPVAPAKKGGAKRKATEDNAVTAADNAVPAADNTAEPASKKSKKPRETKPKTVFIEGYGDLDKPDKDREYTEEEHAAWVQATAARLANEKFKDWVRAKKTFYKNINALSQTRKKKRTQRLIDSESTTDNHLARLLGAVPLADEEGKADVITAEQWSTLNGAYLGGHGFEGIFTAAELDANVALPEKAVPIYTVYRAAFSKGLRPLGIVSEAKKKNKATGVMEYVTNVDNRVFVGVGLPYQKPVKLEASVFCRKPCDRALASEEASTVSTA